MRQIITFNNKNVVLPAPYEPPYSGLKFKSVGTSTISMAGTNNTLDIKYSLNKGISWIQWDFSTITISDGDELFFKGNNPGGVGTAIRAPYFVMSGHVIAYGNIMSLLDDGLCELTVVPAYAFRELFRSCTALYDAENLLLAATTGEQRTTYESMFRGCTNLEKGPTILLNTFGYADARNMFNGCANLNYIKCLATSGFSGNNIQNWTNGVAAAGTFVKKAGVEWPSGASGIPTGWTVIEV